MKKPVFFYTLLALIPTVCQGEVEELLNPGEITPVTPTEVSVKDLEMRVRDLEVLVERLARRVTFLEQTASPRSAVDNDSFPSMPAKKGKVIKSDEPEGEKSHENAEFLGWKEGPMPTETKEKGKKPPKKADEGRLEDTKIPAEPKPEAKSKKSDYQEAGRLLAEGETEKARALFQKVMKEDKKNALEATYWLGTIVLAQDKQPEAAASLFSKVYQSAEKDTPKKSVVFRQSVLLKLAESLAQIKKQDAAQVVLKKFFELKNAKTTLSDDEKKRQSRLNKKAEALQKTLTKESL